MENETIDDLKVNANKVEGGKNEVKLIDASSQTEFVVIDVDLPELKKRMAGEVQEPLTAESIAKTAQSVMNKSGWVYDPATRTYFDYNTNLYYYPQTRLYYNYKNGCYYRYNQETQKYEFHYQLDAFKGQSKGIQELAGQSIPLDVESLCSKFSDIAVITGQPVSYNKSRPETTVVPCIRAMVTSSETLKVGTLFIITCNSEATIGSGNDCDIQIEENGISDKHATLKYFQQQNNYFVTDHGSKTGTTLNSTTENNPGTDTVLATPVTHKSVLLIGSCIFVLHLHLGYETCDDCEPGQIQAMLGNDQPIEPVHTLTKREKDAIRRSELKNIQKRYDLHNEKYRQRKALIGPQYMDRAAERRRNVGSDNPYEKDEMPTSYDTELADHNKGHQMLKKMGWSKGKSLGKSQEGITEPIIPQGTGKGKSGLGFGTAKSRGAR